MPETYVGEATDFADGTRKILTVDGNEVVVFEHAGKPHAISNVCPHSGGPVGEGMIIPKVEAVIGAGGEALGEVFSEAEIHIACPWHGWEYNIETGRCAGDPSVRLRKYEVREQEGKYYVIH